MFGYQPINYTLVADSDVGQYRFVLGSAENHCAQAVAPTGKNVGIAQNDALTGEHVSVCGFGISRCRADAAIAAFAYVAAQTTGGAVTAASGHTVNGIALTSAASGDLFTVFVQPPWKLA